MKKNILFTLLIFLLGSLSVSAREIINFNEGWGFKKGSMGVWGVFPNIYIPQADKTVNLPHTYNDEDFMNDEGYYRGLGSYLKEIEVPESWKGKRIFLKCEGAGTTAAVFVNWNHVGTHKGAYNAFCFELTNYFTYGIKNYILITCDNSTSLMWLRKGATSTSMGVSTGMCTWRLWTMCASLHFTMAPTVCW